MSPKNNALRTLYANDPEAAAFLKKHPEFAGAQIESAHNRTDNEAFYNSEKESTRAGERAAIIQEALHHYWEPSVVKLLVSYYAGASMRDLCRISKRPRGTTKTAIHRAKRKVYNWALMRPWEKAHIHPTDIALDSKTFLFRGAAQRVFLVKGSDGTPYWILEDWAVLPEDVQAILEGTDWEFFNL